MRKADNLPPFCACTACYGIALPFTFMCHPLIHLYMWNWLRRGRPEHLILRNKHSYQQLRTKSVTSQICASADTKLSSFFVVPCSRVEPQFCCYPPKGFPSPEKVTLREAKICHFPPGTNEETSGLWKHKELNCIFTVVLKIYFDFIPKKM